MCTYKATVAYDGTAYKGFQLQNPPDKRNITVQGELEACLTTIFNVERRALRVQGAGRTDSGVHARGQVCGNGILSLFLLVQSTALQLLSDDLPKQDHVGMICRALCMMLYRRECRWLASVPKQESWEWCGSQ